MSSVEHIRTVLNIADLSGPYSDAATTASARESKLAGVTFNLRPWPPYTLVAVFDRVWHDRLSIGRNFEAP